jgi:predicted Zn-dependent protease
VNTPAEVGAMSPKRDARIALQMDSEGDDPKAAADAFLAARAKEVPLEVSDAHALSIGSLSAYQVRGRASTPEGVLVGQITWIAHGGRIYRVSLAAPPFAAEGYSGRVQSATRSFRPLSPDERAAIEVSRLRIVRAGAGESLEKLSERASNAWSLEQTNVANGFIGPLRLTEDQPVKVANREPYTTAGVGEREVQPGASVSPVPAIGR